MPSPAREAILVAVLGCVAANGWDADGQLQDKQDTVRTLACQAGIAPSFALAIIEKESKFRNEIRGSQGEIGASQILPATALALGFDPQRLASEFAYNAKAGVFILHALLKQARGNQRQALLLYRAGPNWAKLSALARSNIHAYVDAIEEIQKKYAGVRCK